MSLNRWLEEEWILGSELTPNIGFRESGFVFVSVGLTVTDYFESVPLAADYMLKVRLPKIPHLSKQYGLTTNTTTLQIQLPLNALPFSFNDLCL